MEMKPKRAWLYGRIDAPEDSLGRLKSQRSELTAYAEHLGMEIAGVSQDMGSGLNLERSGLREVQEAAVAERMDVLLVTQVSRLGRDAGQTMALIGELNRHGVRVASVEGGEIRLDDSRLEATLPVKEDQQDTVQVRKSNGEPASSGLSQSWYG